MRITRSVVLAACVVAFAGPAFSADLGPPAPYLVKAPPPHVASTYDWTGFYAGLHGGWGSFQGAADNFAGLGGTISLSGSGWLGGAQLGYNYQIGSWVLGVEGDWAYTDIHGTNVAPALEQTVRINWVGTVTGRAGIAWDRTLVYFKGGVALGDVRSEALIPSTALFTGGDTRTGWTLGAGVEYGWFGNWTVKAEYDYLDLGTRTVTMTSATGATASQDSEATAHMIKLGANYRFSWR